MKYLKSYKIFENHTDLDSNINDIFLELKDRGLFLNIDHIDRKNLIPVLNVSLINFDLDNAETNWSTKHKTFDLDIEIWDSLHMLVSYLVKEYDYRISMIRLLCEDSDGKEERDYADDLKDLEKIVNHFGYKNFKSIMIRFVKN